MNGLGIRRSGLRDNGYRLGSRVQEIMVRYDCNAKYDPTKAGVNVAYPTGQLC